MLREDESVAWQQDFIDVDLPTGILDSEIGEDGAGVSGNVLRLSKLPPVRAGSRGTFNLAEVELFSDSLTLQSDETWAFEIDAATDVSDVLGVAGSLHIDGSGIIVSLLDGEANAGDVFAILDAGEITGAFNAMALPALDPSLQWYTDALSVDGTLAVTIRGDFDNSGDFTPGDIDLLSAAAGNAGGGVFDLTGDGQVDVADRAHWVTQLVGAGFGDANLDQEVNFSDFLRLSANFAQPGGWGDGDFDGNGMVEFADFLLLSSNFGNAPVAASVPEPTAFILVLGGFLSGLSLRSPRKCLSAQAGR